MLALLIIAGLILLLVLLVPLRRWLVSRWRVRQMRQQRAALELLARARNQAHERAVFEASVGSAPPFPPPVREPALSGEQSRSWPADPAGRATRMSTPSGATVTPRRPSSSEAPRHLGPRQSPPRNGRVRWGVVAAGVAVIAATIVTAVLVGTGGNRHVVSNAGPVSSSTPTTSLPVAPRTNPPVSVRATTPPPPPQTVPAPVAKPPPRPPGSPALGAISPASGAAGQTVIITGSGLFSRNGLVTVLFGHTQAPVACPTQTTCRVTVPARGSPGVVPVTVSTTGGTSNPLPFTYR
ncbi:MAG: IPT/TIG domain-containing protein [Acidimicrobiaceae bacterium]|nr:IPT/TIG domain-containing protein [Acidimicrobiaceae bacterium]